MQGLIIHWQKMAVTIEIIYQDDDIVVVNKPSGVSVTKDRGGDIDLKAAMEEQNPVLAEGLRLVHRIDKETSGVMVLARNKETQSRLSSGFAKRKVKKTYLAIVSGFVAEDEGIIEDKLMRNPRDDKRMLIHKRGKAAVTKWSLIADFGPYALLRVCPLTGRTHQIRMHMKYAGMPLAIDPLYGGKKGIMLSEVKPNYQSKADREEKPLMDRLTLHSYQLQLEGYEGVFVGGLDKNFAAAVKMLSKHSKMIRVKNDEMIEKIVKSEEI